MPNFRNIWRNSTRRSRAIFVGGTGIGALLMTFAPIWDNPASAAITGFQYGPIAGSAGTAVGFRATNCVDHPSFFVDVAFEIDTAAVDDEQTEVDESLRDFQAFELEPDGIYGDDGFATDPPYIAPPEYDFLEGDASAGPTYDVIVYCFTDNDANAQTPPVFDFFVVENGFTYTRNATTSSTAATTSTTAPATTTSTTAPATTTSTTAPATTTSTTAPATTTSTTAPATTTSTTTGATTTSTTAAVTTTSTTPGATTTSTTGGSTTSSTAAGATTSSLPPATLPPATLPPGSTSSTSASPSSLATTSSTVAPTCTVDDTTPTIGQVVAVACGGFAGGSSVAVDLLSDPVRLTTLTANAQGVASGSVTIPITTAGGAHSLRFSGIAPDGSSLVKAIPITVSRELPRTGANSWNIFRVALLLVGIGLVGVGRSQLLLARD